MTGPFSVTGSVSASTPESAGTTNTAGTDANIGVNANITGNATVTVTVTGTVTGTTGVSSVGAYNNLVSSGSCNVQYVNVSGPMGYAPSSRRYKQDIQAAPDAKAMALLMRIVAFRYIQAVEELGDGAALEWAMIAEEGNPNGIKCERVVLALIPVMQDHEARLIAAGL